MQNMFFFFLNFFLTSLDVSALTITLVSATRARHVLAVEKKVL